MGIYPPVDTTEGRLPLSAERSLRGQVGARIVSSSRDAVSDFASDAVDRIYLGITPSPFPYTSRCILRLPSLETRQFPRAIMLLISETRGIFRARDFLDSLFFYLSLFLSFFLTLS